MWAKFSESIDVFDSDGNICDYKFGDVFCDKEAIDLEVIAVKESDNNLLFITLSLSFFLFFTGSLVEYMLGNCINGL